MIFYDFKSQGEGYCVPGALGLMAPSSNLFCPATRVSALAGTTLSAPDEWLFSGIRTIKGTRKAAVLPLPVCAHTCHSPKNFSPTFYFCVMSWVWAPWDLCLVGVSIFHLKWQWKIPRSIRRILWPSKGGFFTVFLDYQIRRTMTSLPDKAAGTECFCTFAWKGPKKKHNGKFTQLQCTLFHFTLQDCWYTVFFPKVYSVYLTIYFPDFCYIDSASLVALEAAAGVGLSYLKLHLSIVNSCCGHLPLSIVDALDTTGRQFLRMSTRICRERFLPAPSQGHFECEHATHFKIRIRWSWGMVNCWQISWKESQNTWNKVVSSQLTTETSKTLALSDAVSKDHGDPKSSVMKSCWRRPCIWWYKSSGFQCYLWRVEYLLSY